MERAVIRRKATEHDGEARDGGVQSVDRALHIIETLAEDDEGYPLSDLAVRTGLSTSTAHRLLATLERRRFVQFDRFEIEMACRRAEFRRRYDFRPPPQFRGAGHAISA